MRATELLAKLLLRGTIGLCLAFPIWAAIGDNAPPIPATYNTGHPRLPHPDATYLANLAANSKILAQYNSDGDAWDSTNPGGYYYLRRLLIAYMADKTADPTRAAAYLVKIKAMQNLQGFTGRLRTLGTDGVGTGTNTLRSATVDFRTACNGASAVNCQIVAALKGYNIYSVSSDGTTITLPAGVVVSGTGLTFSLMDSIQDNSVSISILYDWIYNDLDSGSRTAFANELAMQCVSWENAYVNSDYSPYNDETYIRQDESGLLDALAIYPDHVDGLTHLKFMMDVWFNRLIPAWRQVFGPEGGQWHEGWNDYINRGNGLGSFIVTSTLSWQVASGDPILTRESWLKNFAYATIYMTRPDLLMENYGDVTSPILTAEAPRGSLNGLAAIYNDPVLRGWAHIVNGAPANDFEPSAWPFYTPDVAANPVTAYSSLPKIKNMPGFGMLTARTGWTEDDTSMSFRYGDNFWSHQHSDVGSFTLFNRGLLAADSGSYVSGYSSVHHQQYSRQTVAHNTLTITDPADVYATTHTLKDHTGTFTGTIVNDGGQRQVGSEFNNISQTASPDTIGDWLRNWNYFHMGKQLALASTANYTYTAADITAAYSNSLSDGSKIQVRTNRVSKVVRHALFIPRGTAAYVVIYDQVISTNPAFKKKWLLHTIDQPTITGNKFVVTRAENAIVKPYPDLWPQHFGSALAYDSFSSPNSYYQYNGKLYGWTVYPTSATLTPIGGAGHEFDVEDPLHPGTFTNYKDCEIGLCPANSGLGPTAGEINPVAASTEREPGAWRIEVSPTSAATTDYFLHVMLVTTTGDTSVPANISIPGGLPAGTVGANWTEGGKTYTVTFPQNGVGGHITVTGVADEDLLAHATQLPDAIAIVSGNSQTAPANSAPASPLVVTVTDSAGKPVPNATVHWGISQGSASVAMEWSITNAQGAASTTVTLGPNAVGTAVKTMADVNGLQPVEFTTLVGGQTTPVLSSISCTPTTLNSGAISTCTVTLSQTAPSGGTAVALLSNAPVLTVPLAVTINAGVNTATFTATAGTISTGQAVIITATLAGLSKAETLTLAPPPLVPPAPTLSSVLCTPAAVSSGAASACTVVLTSATGSGGAVVALSSSSSQLTVPASITIPAGSGSAGFTAIAATISSGETAVITATLSGSTQTASLTLSAPSTGGTPLSAKRWIMVPTKGLPVQTVGYEKLVYAPTPVKRAVFLGDYHELGSEPNESLNAYDFETNSWSVLDIGANFHSEFMPEGGHPIGNFAYNPSQNTFLYYCCNSGSNQAENPFFVWWYDPIGQSGRSKQTLGAKPGNPVSGSSAYDVATNTFVLHGGYSGVGTWAYSPATNVWTHQTASANAPPDYLQRHSMVYNSLNHKIYLFGGDAATFYNDLYTYDVTSNTWTKLSPSGTRPAPRSRAGFAYDTLNNVFLVYGGSNGTLFNDVWIYDPAANSWTELTGTSPPPATNNFETLAYDSDHNAFILLLPGTGGYADGQWGGYAAQTWLFRYAGPGPNPGSRQITNSTTPGSANHSSDAWAKEPSLSSVGNALYVGWVETGRPFEASWNHIYSKKYTSIAGWVDLGGTATSLDSEYGAYSESQTPSVALVGGAPWIAWYKWNNSGVPWALWAKSWNGSAWQGGLVGTVAAGGQPDRAFQGRSQLTDVAGTPCMAFLEVDKGFSPNRTLVYVKCLTGGAWTLEGSTSLNTNASGNTVATSVSMIGDGKNPWVAWTEYTTPSLTNGPSTAGQVYVKQWNGSSWIALGGSLNVNFANIAEDAAITWLNGKPYVAWTERSGSGNNQLYVKTYSGGTWNLVGPGSLNRDLSTGWSYHPSLAQDGTNLYVGWIEQLALGQRAQAYVWRYDGSAWSAVGGTLNADPALGSAQRISLAVGGGQPVAAWGEVNPGSVRQVFVKQWNGSSWAPPAGASRLPSCDLNGDGVANILDVQLAINQALHLAPCTTADLMQNGQCNVTDVQRVINAALGQTCVLGQ